LVDPMRTTIRSYTPRARLVRLAVPPVVGAVLLGMQAGNVTLTQSIRQNLAAGTRKDLGK